MKIYTKTGDAGETGIFSGKRIPKSDALIEALGTIDELNASVGVVISQVKSSKLKVQSASSKSKVFRIITEDLEDVQEQLFAIGSAIAGFPAKDIDKKLEDEVKKLEENIDTVTAEMPPLQNFILPGGTLSAALLHLARAVCRRAERRLVVVPVMLDTHPVILRYMNRLSDYLFTLARRVNFKSKAAEKTWTWKY